MLENSVSYDASLEAFSKSLQTLVDYSLGDEGSMTVHNDTVRWYRYIDTTPQAEVPFRFIEHRLIDKELEPGLAFLLSYDRARVAILEIVDMPSRKNDLFIRFCRQNNYRLSACKRESHFNFLTDEEVRCMEVAASSACDGSLSST